MRRWVTAVAAALAVALLVTACGGGGGDEQSARTIGVEWGEPENPLIPGNTTRAERRRRHRRAVRRAREVRRGHGAAVERGRGRDHHHGQLDLYPGETLGVVGESGCGKSTLAQVLMRLLPPTGGTATFEGEDLFAKRGAALKAWRRDMQIVLQDPYTSLNPRRTVGDIVGEPFDIHPEVAPKGDRRRRVQELLEVVGLNPEHIRRYPHQFSGGQRQGIGIARALALRPKVIVCDEPVSALDVSIQAQVLNLFSDLQRELGLAYLFIAHDLGVVRHLCDRVAVMYLGSIVETGSNEEISTRASHPYTQALLSSVPVPDPTVRRERLRLTG
jgi:oligopeptide transport system ATP-binding protein